MHRADIPVLAARSRSLRRVSGLPDSLVLRLEALVPPGSRARTVVVEQRLTRHDAERNLAAFDIGKPCGGDRALRRPGQPAPRARPSVKARPLRGRPPRAGWLRPP